MEDLDNWVPQENVAYKGYSRYSRRGYHSGRVVIHINNDEYVGGFFIAGTKTMIWYNQNHVKKEVSMPTSSCTFTKRREGNTNIYDVILNDEDMEIEDESSGNDNVSSGSFEPTSRRDAATIVDRLFHTRDLKEWTEIFQDELNQRWRTFDNNLEGLSKEWKTFKKTQMEITEAYDNAQTAREEWRESLTSLGNLINKKTTHEKGMWSITQSTRQNRNMKIKQKFIRAGVDEMNFNSMTDYIKQYPELQSSAIIEKAVDKADEKRKEVVEAEKLYNQKMKETNTYLNTSKSDLQRIENQLTSFETIKNEGVKKIDGEMKKPLNRIRIKYWWTPKEQQRLQLYLNESDRKIGESRDQLKLMKDDLKEYQEREFKPIVTQKFSAIE